MGFNSSGGAVSGAGISEAAITAKKPLSGSTDGRPIKITQTATAGDLLHTATGDANRNDELWIYANTTSSADVELTIEFGGATSPDGHIVVGIPFKEGSILVVPGISLQAGLEIRAFASVADVVNITGYYNRVKNVE